MPALENQPLDEWSAYDLARLLRESMASAPDSVGFKDRPYWRRAPPLVQLVLMARKIKRGEYLDDTDPPTEGAVILGP